MRWYLLLLSVLLIGKQDCVLGAPQIVQQQANAGRASENQSASYLEVLNRQEFRPAVNSLPPLPGQRTILDQAGQPMQLPAVCTSDLPGFANAPGQATGLAPELQMGANGNPGRSSTSSPSASKPQAFGSAGQNSDSAQAWQSRAQMRAAFRQLVQDPAEVEAERARMPNVVRKTPSRASEYQTVAYPQSGYPQPGSGYRTVRASISGGYNPHAEASAAMAVGPDGTSNVPGSTENALQFDPHEEVFSASLFPSAIQCAKCHQQIFDEWASSSHAYASISPMFHKFEDAINRLSQGTIGYFCLRCHAPVATTVGLRRDQPIWDGPRVFREGVTCIACHHIQEVTVKTNGERRIEPGPITDPVTGAGSGEGIEAAIKYKDHFKVKTDPDDKSLGQLIHKRIYKFQEIAESSFCVSCHQVAVQPGIKLEVVWDQYRASPACREGVTCQDCHMGKVPGVAEGYSLGPAAVVDGRVINPLRKHSNHMFYGPGYSIAHPGTFPHDPAQDRWTIDQWLDFNWRGGWGTDEFEDKIADGVMTFQFPQVWANADDRYDARDIVDKNLKKLEYKRQIRRQVLENGSHIDGPFFVSQPTVGKAIAFHYCVINKSTGHNMPSGSLGAQPQLWLNTVLTGPDGQRLWESGYLDSNGDLADWHSLDVLDRKIPIDKQLFNLQTKFLTTNVKGTDREMYLPVNFDIDQLPFLRPAAQPVTVLNHPPFIRMEGHSIPALGSRKAKYRIPSDLVQQPGTYRLSVRMRSRAEPIYFMKFVGATPEMIRSMNQWIVDVHPHTVTFDVR